MLPVGQVLFRRGEPADAAELVVSGALSLDPQDGRPIGRATPDTLLDESALLAPGVRTATATASEPATVVGISRSVMTRVLEAYPNNAVALRRYWAERLGRRLDAVRAATRP